jgi:hypothetical protein
MRITFANTYTTAGGRKFNAGTTTELKDAEARHLIHVGKARKADSEEEPKSDATAEDANITNEGA